ncbi:MAG: RpiB/LacA/LacB family sugar-phosphate isomerase [Candidatus Peribacteraceae bacterium]|nr:RpiB/LacA/LacB family sugar-phosphate isomerase [Candidatus Peribacteraceae bacterium]
MIPPRKPIYSIACDRHGFNYASKLEEALSNNGHAPRFFGATTDKFSLPIPTYVHELAWHIHKDVSDFGITITDNSNVNIACITANRIPHIRASVVSCVGDALLAKKTAYANVICINSAGLDYKMIEEIVFKFIAMEVSSEEWHRYNVYLADMLYIPK